MVKDPFIANKLILLDLIELSDKSDMLANRIKKNYKSLKKWAKKNSTDCFRLYDRDIPEIPVAIDYYAGRFNIQYFRKKSNIDENVPQEIIAEVNSAIMKCFNVFMEGIFWKIRKQRQKLDQYEKQDERGATFPVYENGLRFLINLTDYLDTGLFLDHRNARKIIMETAKDKVVLNLFSYTASFSVYAAAGGAKSSVTVDMSNTYTEWGKKNFQINKISTRVHKILRDDCIKFIEDEIFTDHRYDLVILDPPTISRSKKMTGMFDVNRDYVELLNKIAKILNPGGKILFSNNSLRFKMNFELLPDFKIEDITAKTLPHDFKNKKIHKAWMLEKI